MRRIIGKRSKPVRYAKAPLTRFGSVLRGTAAPLRTPLMAAPLRDSSRRAKALWSETRGRSAPRFAHIRKKGHGQQSVVPLAALAPQPPARRAGQSPRPPGEVIAREATYPRNRQCPESAYINIIPSGLCNKSPRAALVSASHTIRIMLSTLRQ